MVPIENERRKNNFLIVQKTLELLEEKSSNWFLSCFFKLERKLENNRNIDFCMSFT